MASRFKIISSGLERERGSVFFYPHPADDITIDRIANYKGKDLYYLLVEDEKILGYGILRGWDEGYQTPSLGIAISPCVRGSGLGTLLMNFLHVAASRRGSRKVRLRVLKNNKKAISLYKNSGYVFKKDIKQPDYLVGFKILGISM